MADPSVGGHPPPFAEQLGERVAWTALRDGVQVYDRDHKRVGVVERVIETRGLFEGVLVHTYPLPGKHLYADADQIAEIREQGVVLSVRRDKLHEPTRRAGRRREETPLEGRLRHAWDRITRRTA